MTRSKKVKKTIWARVGPEIDKWVRNLSQAMGISISEYVRTLILQDLESKGMFKEELKKNLERSEKHEKIPENSIRESLRHMWDE